LCRTPVALRWRPHLNGEPTSTASPTATTTASPTATASPRATASPGPQVHYGLRWTGARPPSRSCRAEGALSSIQSSRVAPVLPLSDAAETVREALSGLCEGVGGVFTVSPESSERTCIPHLLILGERSGSARCGNPPNSGEGGSQQFILGSHNAGASEG
jgi:hypothetical protein